ncbi:MAG: twin-arginine translocase TatA/TatE family subunit [Paludibacteraceae bacterium]|nr:twin-arginine translocase TatA/TatE family subunit [Paludibacteraceae bacterium]
MLGGSEIIFIVILVLLLFGGKKIPELMKGVGKGVKSFKDGMNGVPDDNEKTKEETSKNSDEIRDK